MIIMKKPNADKLKGQTPPPVPVDDSLRPVPLDALVHRLKRGGEIGLPAFVLARLDALEKPKLEEALLEPGGGNPCGCNSVCACVPVETCACNQVCVCDTVSTCQSYDPGCYGGGGGYGGYYAPCH
jgi:hypothetical protein